MTEGMSPVDDVDDVEGEKHIADQGATPTPFTADVLRTLSTEFGEELLKAQPVGGWELAEVICKMGKTEYPISISS